jgi:hypothetical protein
MIGLGRMGGNMVIRFTKAGHECLVYDSHHEAVDALVAKGAKGTTSLPDFVKQLSKPRLVWMMVPAGAVDPVIESLIPLLEKGDIVVDGGNSYYHDDIRRAEALRKKGLHYVDVGVSGGVWGLERLLPHDRWRARGGETSRPDLPVAGPRCRRGATHPGRDRRARNRREGLSALRAERRRTFREDGTQRHRIRNDGGLCRRPEHH